jgi:hypothetical protein
MRDILVVGESLLQLPHPTIEGIASASTQLYVHCSRVPLRCLVKREVSIFPQTVFHYPAGDVIDDMYVDGTIAQSPLPYRIESCLPRLSRFVTSGYMCRETIKT